MKTLADLTPFQGQELVEAEALLEECFNSAPDDDTDSYTGAGRSICAYCGERGHSMKKCRRQKKDSARPAKHTNGKCNNCGGKGHKGRDCHHRKQPQQQDFAMQVSSRVTADSLVIHSRIV